MYFIPLPPDESKKSLQGSLLKLDPLKLTYLISLLPDEFKESLQIGYLRQILKMESILFPQYNCIGIAIPSGFFSYTLTYIVQF